MDAGYTYSHTTPVVYLDGERLAHHTYARGQRKVSVHRRGGRWLWGSKASSASGRETRGASVDALRRYLRNVTRRTETF